MTQYMLLLYANEAAGDAVSPDDMAMWMEKMGEYSDALKKAGAFVSTAGLGRSRSARTIHANKDELQVHDGPMPTRRNSWVAITSSPPPAWTTRRPGPQNVPPPSGVTSKFVR